MVSVGGEINAYGIWAGKMNERKFLAELGVDVRILTK